MPTSTAGAEVVVPLRRSARSDWKPERLDALVNTKVNANQRLQQAARAVLDRLIQDLSGLAMGVFLVDERAQIIERALAHDEFIEELDAMGMREGQRWAAPDRMPSAVAPIADPRSGRLIGALGLVCRAAEANPLMRPYMRQASREIAGRLVDDAGAAERTLLERFVHVRRKSRGPVIAVNERTMLTNAAAARFVDDDDQSGLWQWAQRAMSTDERLEDDIELARGTTMTARCEPVRAGGTIVGALIRFDHSRRQRRAQTDAKASRQTAFGWDSLSAAEHGVARLVAGGLTNQEVGARLFLSRHTVDFHLRQIFNKLGIRSRVELTRIVVELSAA